MDLEGLVRSYGYAAVLCGTLVEGETVVVVAGFLSHRGYLHPPLVAAAAFTGSFLVDQFFFFLGRRQGRRLLLRRERWQTGAARAEVLLERFGTWLILGFRFLYGFRTVTPFVIGMSRVPAARFALLNAAGAAAWAVAFTAGGYFFGKVMEVILGDLRRHEGWLLLALATAGIALWFLRALRGRHRPSGAPVNGG
jgi:membrane protein DedA with SNARE-associated domain